MNSGKFQRKSGLLQVIPCMILVVVGSFTFILPVDSGEKISLSVTILLAMTVMVQLVMDSVPAASNGVPYMGKRHRNVRNTLYVCSRLCYI